METFELSEESKAEFRRKTIAQAVDDFEQSEFAFMCAKNSIKRTIDRFGRVGIPRDILASIKPNKGKK